MRGYFVLRLTENKLGKWVVFDEDGKIVLITCNKRIAETLIHGKTKKPTRRNKRK